MELDHNNSDDDSKGGFICPTSDESNLGDGVQNEEEESRQRSQLFAAENHVRMCMNLTSMEKHQLQNLMQHHFSSGEPEVVLACFGKPAGRAMTKQVYSTIVQSKCSGYTHSEAFSILMSDWSLGKSLLLSSRAVQPAPAPGEECYCIPRTSFLPKGCYHKQLALGQAPHSSKTKPWHCSQCSLCLRCHKNFGWVS